MIRLHALGSLDLRDAEGHEILSVLAQPKRLALLAFLAASPTGSFHRRDTLLGIFWPESDQQHARDSLRQAVRHLRRSLGEGVIVGRGDEEIGIDPGMLWCDAAAFQQALAAGEPVRALGYYRGPLLAGFFLSEVPDFERWLERERARLLEKAGEAAWVVAQERQAAGDRLTAGSYARRALELSPQDEGTLRRLMAMLTRLGDRASAVRAYEAFAARLAEECGVEPSPETRLLADEIRTGGMDVAEPTVSDAGGGTSSLLNPSQRGSAPGLPREMSMGSGPAAGPTRGPRVARRGAALLALGTGLLVLAVAAVAASVLPSSPQHPDRVVIVPFQNFTGDPTLDPLGRWATDWLTQSLTRTSGVRVVDAAVGLPGSATAPPGASRLRRLLHETGARTAIHGAYYRQGDSIQFQVRISDAEGDVVESVVESVSASLTQPHGAAQILSERITGTLAARSDPWTQALNAEGSRPPSYEAYQAWIDGVEQYSRRSFPAARESLMQAASLDSSFVTPLIWGAAAGIHLHDYAWADSLLLVADSRRERLLPADRHFLDIKRAELRGDRAASYRAGRQLVEVAPASELALYLFGKSALAMNRPAEAVEALRQIDAARSSVDWDTYGTGLPAAYHLAGDYAGELVEAQRVRTARPGLLRAANDEARALAALGRTGDVLQLLDAALTLPAQPGISPAAMAMHAAMELSAHGHDAAGDQALARALAWCRTRPSMASATEEVRYDIARVFYLARRWDEAEPLFRRLAERAPENAGYLGPLGVMAVHRGDTREADRISVQLSRLDGPFLRGTNTLWRARIAAVAGRRAEAVALLRAAYSEGQGDWLSLHADPDFASLRGYAAFQRLLRPAG